MVPTANISVIRGATKPDVVWRFMSAGQPFDGTGSVFTLTIKTGRGQIQKSTADADGLTYDNVTGRLRWRRTVSESRQIQPGRVGQYEIERFIGADQSLIVQGAVVGQGGLSND